MKALTIYQPWASLIIAGAKPYEFRGWKPYPSVIGQRIGIHASARPVKRQNLYDLILRLQGDEAWSTCLVADKALPILQHALDDPDSLLRSHMMGTAILGDPKSGLEIAHEFSAARSTTATATSTQNWGWPMLDIKSLLPPEPMPGLQGLWNWRGESQ